MPGLLAAQVRATTQHFFEDVTVTDGFASEAQTFGLKRALESEIRHRRADYAPAVQMARGFQKSCHGQQHAVAVHVASAGAHKHGAVRITVKSHAERSARVDHFLTQGFRMQRTATIINIAAVRLIVNSDYVGAE